MTMPDDPVVPAQVEIVARVKARRAARDASGVIYVEGSIYEGIEACLVRDGRTVAHVVRYADAVEIADRLAAEQSATSRAEAAEKERDIERAWRKRLQDARLDVQGDLAIMEVRVRALEEALRWYGEQARLCRLIHSEGDVGRQALDADGGKRARAALQATANGEDG